MQIFIIAITLLLIIASVGHADTDAKIEETLDNVSDECVVCAIYFPSSRREWRAPNARNWLLRPLVHFNRKSSVNPETMPEKL